MSSLGDEKYLLVTTFRKSGEGVPTPVWVVPTSDGRIGFWTAGGTGKITRIRRDPRVTIQPCDARGRPSAGSAPVEGVAEILTSGPLFDEVSAAIRRKYGLLVPVTKAVGRLLARRAAGRPHDDTVVLIRREEG